VRAGGVVGDVLVFDSGVRTRNGRLESDIVFGDLVQAGLIVGGVTVITNGGAAWRLHHAHDVLLAELWLVSMY